MGLRPQANGDTMRDKETLTAGIVAEVAQLRAPLTVMLQWATDLSKHDPRMSSEIQDQILNIDNAIDVIKQETGWKS